MKPARAEFRLRPGRKKRVTIPDDESIYLRAQAILAAHTDLKSASLTESEEATLRAIVARASRAQRLHPNTEVEVSPYIAALLRLEE